MPLWVMVPVATATFSRLSIASRNDCHQSCATCPAFTAASITLIASPSGGVIDRAGSTEMRRKVRIERQQGCHRTETGIGETTPSAMSRAKVVRRSIPSNRARAC